MSLKALLKGKLTKKELSCVPRSFDVVGGKEKAVAIIEIPDRLESRKRVIASSLMRKHKNVKSVLAKASARKGVYRTRDYEFLRGDRNTEVVHVESGCRFLLDPQKVYFSPREGTERQRISDMVKKKEVVMVFFAGVGPLAIVIARKSKPKRVVGIELNEEAVRYFWQNVRLNRLDNVDAVHGDVRQKAKEYYGKCDRVIMPLPEKAVNYLKPAVSCLKKRGTIHLYFFSEEKKASMWAKKVKSRMAQMKKACKISVSGVLPYGPGIWKYRMDIELL